MTSGFWYLSKCVGIKQIFPHTLLITGHLWLQDFLELRKMSLHLALYIAFNQFLSYMVFLLLSKPKALDVALQWAVVDAGAQL